MRCRPCTSILMPLRKIGKTWFVDIYKDGHRIRKRASTDKATAKKIHDQLLVRRDLHRFGLAPGNTSIDELRGAFLAELRPRQLPNIFKTSQSYLASILSACEGPPQSLRQRVNEYIAKKQAEGKAPRTINLAVGLLKRMLAYGVKHNLVSFNPLSDLVPLRGKKKERRALTNGEVQKLLDVSGPYRSVWEFFLLTGLRKGELVNLQWQDIDFKGGWFQVRQSKTQAGIRKIPLSKRLKEILASLPKKSGHVFTTQKGTPLRNNLRRAFHTCLRHAGIDPTGLDIHALRYTFATRLASQGVHPKYVQALLGHTSALMSLDIYTKIVSEELRQAMERGSQNLVKGKTQEASRQRHRA